MTLRFAAWLLAVLGIAACGSQTVKPWDRDILAQEQMQLDAKPMFTIIDDKIYFSREGARGGASVGGGGCGCN